MKVSTRYGGFAGLVAGLDYLIQAVMGLKTGLFSGIPDRVIEAIYIITLLATIVGLIGLHSYAQIHYGKAGSTGFWLAVIGTGLMTVSTMAALFVSENSPQENALGFAFLGGVLLTMIGYLAVGIMAWRGKVLPLRAGLALILGFPLSIFLSPGGGGILFGLAWSGVGYTLLKQETFSNI